MGDFLKNGTKIGTCGNAYYATLEMLEKHVLSHGNVDDAHWYIDPQKSCSFAFPFPEYDDKSIGNFSNFHQEDRANFFFSIEIGQEDIVHHKEICQSLSPDGGTPVNVFFPCPCSKDAKISTNFDPTRQTFRLEEQAYHQKGLCISASCVYCGCRNIFSFDEALKIVEGLLSRADALIKRPLKELASGKTIQEPIPEQNQLEAKYLHQIIKRILATYD